MKRTAVTEMDKIVKSTSPAIVENFPLFHHSKNLGKREQHEIMVEDETSC